MKEKINSGPEDVKNSKLICKVEGLIKYKV